MRRLLTMGLLLMVLVLLVLPTALARLTVKPAPAPQVDGSDTLLIHVYFPDEEAIRTLELGDYLKGVVAAEMPPDFATEALKAQFIAARTYAVKRMQQFNGPGKGGCPLSPQADICANYATGQAYITRGEVAEKYGALVAENLWRRLDQVEADTEGLVLIYGGEVIDPLYHSVSGTYTEDAADYFSQSVPYLKPVDDHWGADAPKLHQEVHFTPSQLAAALNVGGRAVAVSAVAAATSAGRPPVEIVTRTATNRVKTVRVGGLLFSGRELREQLGLRSTNFTVTIRDGDVVIQTTGYGHGVGMSQYGADGMARAGKSAEEILTYYYQGATLARLFDG